MNAKWRQLLMDQSLATLVSSVVPASPAYLLIIATKAIDKVSEGLSKGARKLWCILKTRFSQKEVSKDAMDDYQEDTQMVSKVYTIDAVKVKRLMLDKWGDVEQKKLADAAGFSEQTLVRLFKGYGFSPESLYGICHALGVTPNDVLTIAPKEPALVKVAAHNRPQL